MPVSDAHKNGKRTVLMRFAALLTGSRADEFISDVVWPQAINRSAKGTLRYRARQPAAQWALCDEAKALQRASDRHLSARRVRNSTRDDCG
jgi:hypothetical protein